MGWRLLWCQSKSRKAGSRGSPGSTQADQILQPWGAGIAAGKEIERYPGTSLPGPSSGGSHQGRYLTLLSRYLLDRA